MRKNILLSFTILACLFLGSRAFADCNGDFTYTISGTTVSFKADASNGANTKFSWKFGDGATSNDRNPSHKYLKEGSFEVCLTAADSPCENKKCYTIIMGKNPVYCISGQVKAGKDAVSSGYVILYKYRADDSSWNPVDTVNITYDSIHGTARYEFGKVAVGSYEVKVVLDSSSSEYKKFLSTYYGDKIHWKEGKKIEITNSCVDGKNVNLHEDGSHSGKGSGEGHVSNEHKKAGANEALLVQLLDAKDSIVEFAYTDANGDFKFTNLANGEYKVYTEFTGIPTYPAIINITDANSTIKGIEIHIGQTSVTNSGINENTLYMQNHFTIYPNPAGNKMNVNISAVSSVLLNGSILDLNGKVIKTLPAELHQGLNLVNIDIADLKPGMYIIMLSNGNGVLLHSHFVKE